ncbi:MAG: hypothetical protein DMG11_01675 [Acidobacteria bacterium]|nr:MAG: hypothetical protein DMG11_01675 [Acidobacteriota bacterium]
MQKPLGVLYFEICKCLGPGVAWGEPQHRKSVTIIQRNARSEDSLDVLIRKNFLVTLEQGLLKAACIASQDPLVVGRWRWSSGHLPLNSASKVHQKQSQNQPLCHEHQDAPGG